MSFISEKSEYIPTQDKDEYEVKAAFIYNFTKYITWEDSKFEKASSFKIGIYKDSPIESYLVKLIENKKVSNKKIEIVKINSLEEIDALQLVFVPSKTITKEFKEISADEDLKSSLIVSEKQGRLNLGAGINFLLVTNRIKFEINLNNIKNNKLKVSSQLLKLAEKIEE